MTHSLAIISRDAVKMDKEDKIYKGQWIGNQRDGRGEEVNLEEKTYYIGEFKEDKKDGYGRIVMDNGIVYEGDWQEGVAHGEGKDAICNL